MFIIFPRLPRPYSKTALKKLPNRRSFYLIFTRIYFPERSKDRAFECTRSMVLLQAVRKGNAILFCRQFGFAKPDCVGWRDACDVARATKNHAHILVCNVLISLRQNRRRGRTGGANQSACGFADFMRDVSKRRKEKPPPKKFRARSFDISRACDLRATPSP